MSNIISSDEAKDFDPWVCQAQNLTFIRGINEELNKTEEL